MKNRVIATALVLFILACTSAVAPPDRPPSITGTLKGAKSPVLVEDLESRWGCDLIYIEVADGTTEVIVHTPSGSRRKGSASDLREGATANIWVQGDIYQTYPCQALAKVIEIL